MISLYSAYFWGAGSLRRRRPELSGAPAQVLTGVVSCKVLGQESKKRGASML